MNFRGGQECFLAQCFPSLREDQAFIVRKEENEKKTKRKGGRSLQDYGLILLIQSLSPSSDRALRTNSIAGVMCATTA